MELEAVLKKIEGIQTDDIVSLRTDEGFEIGGIKYVDVLGLSIVLSDLYTSGQNNRFPMNKIQDITKIDQVSKEYRTGLSVGVFQPFAQDIIDRIEFNLNDLSRKYVGRFIKFDFKNGESLTAKLLSIKLSELTVTAEDKKVKPILEFTCEKIGYGIYSDTIKGFAPISHNYYNAK